MRALLDTHVFLWAVADPDSISRKARGFIESGRNRLILSVVSLWEIQLKADKGMLFGQLKSAEERNRFLQEQIRALNIEILGLQPSHVYALAGLPAKHRDPFDRLLIAQAKVEGLALITGDRLIQSYPVETIW